VLFKDDVGLYHGRLSPSMWRHVTIYLDVAVKSATSSSGLVSRMWCVKVRCGRRWLVDKWDGRGSVRTGRWKRGSNCVLISVINCHCLQLSVTCCARRSLDDNDAFL